MTRANLSHEPSKKRKLRPGRSAQAHGFPQRNRSGTFHQTGGAGNLQRDRPVGLSKSKRILDGAIKVLEKEELKADWAGPIQGLALLATGKPEYLPKLQDFARILAALLVDPNKKPSGPTWGNTWPMAYQSLFLCEYYMVTGDKEVLPAIEKNALQLAAVRACMGPSAMASPHSRKTENSTAPCRPTVP